jgi:VWFA-related protein
MSATASAADLVLRGKVVMEDGSVPDRKIAIERDCGNMQLHVATTNSRGEYSFRADVDTPGTGLLTSTGVMGSVGGSVTNVTSHASCMLRASLPGYESNAIALSVLNSFSDPVLPTFVLVRRGKQANFDMLTASGVPRSASIVWSRAIKSIHAKNYPEAERQLRAAVASAPRFAQGWNALASVLVLEQKTGEAREAYRTAIALNPKLVPERLILARLDITANDWNETLKTAEGLIQADIKREYPEAYLYQALARYQLNDLAGAEASAIEAIRLDRRRDVPAAEYVYGLILEARRTYASAGEHMAKYLELKPKAPDADAVRSRMQSLGTGEPVPVSTALQSVAANLQPTRAGDAWVPGGMKALAAAARMSRIPPAQDFFTEYCRTIAREMSVVTSQGIPQYLDTLRAYISTVSALSLLGRRENDRTVVELSLANDPARTSRLLQLLGWKLTPNGNSIEPGDQSSDGLAQKMPALLEIDEFKMAKTLEAGRVFQFELLSESAPLIGGGIWTDLLKDKTLAIAAAFATDTRLAQVYAGLGAMGIEAASALMTGVGLRTLVALHSDALARDGDAFALSNRAVATPGDPAVWQKLAGANPNNPPAFFRALLEKDQGSLLEFYYAVWRSDAAHRRFFTQNADRFYAWHRIAARNQRADFLETLPLGVNGEENGRVKFPGGRRAWTSSTAPEVEALLKLDAPGALAPLARIEQKRGAPIEEASVKLLLRHFNDWRTLFPYFEELPGLGRDQFEALESFTAAVEKLPAATRNMVLGEWDSLVELIARGVAAGSLDPAQGARAFRDACLNLANGDSSGKALEVLRTLAGGDDLDAAVPARLLRLTPARRVDFDRVLELQAVPRISAAKTPRETLAVLTGIIYAASLDPDGLLVNEDPALLSKHRFSGDQLLTLFPKAALIRSSDGSYLSGSFANFDRIASSLAAGGGSPVLAAARNAVTGAAALPAEGEPSHEAVTFRASGRLVEVYTTVTDSSGRYIDNLSRDQFTVSDNGVAQKIVAFEPRSSKVSVALLLDTTGSMQGALPALKNAAFKLIGELRPEDSIAVYSFNSAVSQLQPFTTDKDAAKRAVLHTLADGETAFYDALTRVGRDLSGLGGKKVIVVFTDGNDNASTLTADTAIERAKAAGIPVYTIAQGNALSHPESLKQLAAISKATGGVSFAIHGPNEIRGVFEKVAADLTHGYLLVFQPAPAEDHSWRTIEIGPGSKRYKIRARDGYYPD